MYIGPVSTYNTRFTGPLEVILMDEKNNTHNIMSRNLIRREAIKLKHRNTIYIALMLIIFVTLIFVRIMSREHSIPNHGLHGIWVELSESEYPIIIEFADTGNQFTVKKYAMRTPLAHPETSWTLVPLSGFSWLTSPSKTPSYVGNNIYSLLYSGTFIVPSEGELTLTFSNIPRPDIFNVRYQLVYDDTLELRLNRETTIFVRLF